MIVILVILVLLGYTNLSTYPQRNGITAHSRAHSTFKWGQCRLSCILHMKFSVWKIMRSMGTVVPLHQVKPQPLQQVSSELHQSNMAHQSRGPVLADQAQQQDKIQFMLVPPASWSRPLTPTLFSPSPHVYHFFPVMLGMELAASGMPWFFCQCAVEQLGAHCPRSCWLTYHPPKIIGAMLSHYHNYFWFHGWFLPASGAFLSMIRLEPATALTRLSGLLSAPELL